MPRERHQNGWVKVSGQKEKKWIGHWMPYREDGAQPQDHRPRPEVEDGQVGSGRISSAPTSPKRRSGRLRPKASLHSSGSGPTASCRHGRGERKTNR